MSSTSVIRRRRASGWSSGTAATSRSSSTIWCSKPPGGGRRGPARPTDLRRDGRLGDADARRGSIEAALLGDCDEVFQLAQLHNESL
jgi:hypothetical protein